MGREKRDAMEATHLIDRLERHAKVIDVLIGEPSADVARWKPSATAWSILNVAAHLLDEEREDFRIRLDLLLRDPTAEWPPIDPRGCARGATLCWIFGRRSRHSSTSERRRLPGFADLLIPIGVVRRRTHSLG